MRTRPFWWEEAPAAPQLIALKENLQSAPIADLAGDSGSAEGHHASDSVTVEVADSLSKPRPSVSHILIGGVLREFPTTEGKTPRGVPSADEEFSSWGNETLWQ